MTIDDAHMNVNGKVQEIDPGRGTTPLIRNQRTLVPIRAIVETMDGTVGWTESTGEISLARSGKRVIMFLNKLAMTVDGQSKTLDVAPQSINSRTMVPIRFAAENLNCEIDWLNSTKQVVIVYK